MTELASAKASDAAIVAHEALDGAMWLNWGPLWLTQGQMTNFVERDRSVLNRRIHNVFAEGELSPESSCANSAQVQLNECSFDEDRPSTLPSMRVVPFAESTPLATDVMARLIVNPLVESNA